MNRIQGLFPSSFASAFIKIDPGHTYDLTEEEEASLHGVSEKRRREFSAGRYCARRALALLGVSNASIPFTVDRVPLWPDNTIGSISHTKTGCAVVVARREKCSAIGIDIEEVNRLTRKYWSKVLRPREMAFLETISKAEDPVPYATLMFGIKEAFYKYQYPITGEYLGFQEAEVSIINQPEGIFVLKLVSAFGGWKRGYQFYGSYKFFESYVVSALWSH